MENLKTEPVKQILNFVFNKLVWRQSNFLI